MATSTIPRTTSYQQIADYGQSVTLERNNGIVHLFTRAVEPIANVAGNTIISSENAMYRPKRIIYSPAIVRRVNVGYEIAIAVLQTDGILKLSDNGGNNIPANSTTFDYCIFDLSYALK